jgi:hypothetical protein
VIKQGTCVILYAGTEDETIAYIADGGPNESGEITYDIEGPDGIYLMDQPRSSFVLFAE